MSIILSRRAHTSNGKFVGPGNGPQVGFFHHGGTLQQETESKDDEIEQSVEVQVESVGENLVLEQSAKRLVDLHGEHKISLCLAVLGLETEGGARALLQHIMEST